MKDLSQTLWEAFDKKQPSLEEFINHVQLKRKNNAFQKYVMITQYNNFIQQSLELKHLVPAKDDKVLKKPEKDTATMSEFTNGLSPYEIRYLKVKEQCIYEGFELYERNNMNTHYTNYEGGVFYFSNKKQNITGTRNHGYYKSFGNTIAFFESQPVTLNFWKQVLK